MKRLNTFLAILVVVIWMTYSIVRAINFSPGNIPFPYDQNQVVGKKLGGVQIEAAEFMIVDVNCTHPRDFPFVITVVSSPPGVYIINNAGNWQVQWTTDVNDVGTHYIVLEASDTPPPPWKSKTRQATLIIQVVELNPGPVFHELEDTVIAMHVWPNDYQKRWQELKKENTIMVGPVQVPLEWEISG